MHVTTQFGSRSTASIAHRGARAFAPENTLEAIDKAAAIGADMVEVDVQLTADGQLVVVHDDTLERCSNVAQVFPGRQRDLVAAFTLDEIVRLDAGSWFVRAVESPIAERPSFLASLSAAELREFTAKREFDHYRSGKVRHPTLVQVLDRCRALGIGVNIELKTCGDNGRPLAQAVARLLRTAPSAEDLVRNKFPVSHKPDAQARDDSQNPSLARRDPVPPAKGSNYGAGPETLSVGTSSREAAPHTDSDAERLHVRRSTPLVSSFDHAALVRFKQLQPNVPIGVLVTRPLADPVGYCRSLGAAAYHPGCTADADCVGFDSEHYRLTGRLPAEPFRSLHEAGIAVNVWTENDPDRMQLLIDAGVTGIVTDYPNRLAALLRARV
jgi:glycerophosphoryl diester phosphodiesterase